MFQPQHIGHSNVGEQQSFSLHLADFPSTPASISLPSRRFIAFLAADATGIDETILSVFARTLLCAGCVYFCAWGTDCERVHDVFDKECLKVEPVITTTWHSKDSLDEALWYFIFNAFPEDEYLETTRSALAISIGRPEWNEQICRRLSDLDLLNWDVVYKT